MIEQVERQRVIAVAQSYLRTPYHHAGRVKGVGVDCLTLLALVYSESGLIDTPEIPHYPPDWHLHRSTERYLNGLLQYTREVPVPQPGDIALWRFGRAFSHGAIVIQWPQIIHAYVGSGCVLEDANRAVWLRTVGESAQNRGKEREIKFFSCWGR